MTKTVLSDWLPLLHSLGVPREPALAAFAGLEAAYRQERRAYHNLEHIEDVLRWVSRLALYAASLPPLRLAAWYHDVVYDPAAADNEAQSAALARRQLSGLGLAPDLVGEVARLILLTAGHEATPTDANAHVLLDADLAVLGAARARYEAYARAIRREYAHLSLAAFREGRQRVLRQLLARRSLFQTPLMRATREAQARLNLHWELAQWESGGWEE